MLKYMIEIVGWLAAALMLSAYLLLTSGRLTSRSTKGLYGVLGRHFAAPSSTAR